MNEVDDLICYIITLKDDPDNGSYSIKDEFDNVVIYMFKEYDDAMRFAELVEAESDISLDIIEVNLQAIDAACKVYGYNYIVFSECDIVVPPENCVFV